MEDSEQPCTNLPRTILIVDDNQGLISLIQRCLSREGFKTAVALSGQEALNWLSHHQADLLLLDLQLPDMTGEDLIQHLDSRAITLPFIVVTGQGDERLAVKMMKRGARDYFIKDSSVIALLPSIVAQTFEQLQQEHRLVLMEEALRAERERLAITLASIVEGVLTTDISGRITYMNRMAEELSEWKQEEADGRPIDEVVRFVDDGLDTTKAHPVNQVLQHGRALHPLHPISLCSRTFTERPVVYSVSPLRQSDGKLLGSVLILRDMSERMKLDQELLKTSKLESLGRLAGGIAHDFNNLLTAILGNLSMIQTRIHAKDFIFPFVSEAEHASLRAKALTLQLLTFAKGGSPLKKPLALQQMVTEAATFALSGSSTCCRCELPDDLWLVDADEGQLGTVIHNLAINAQQAMPAGGILHIRGENVHFSEEEAKQHMLSAPGYYVKLTLQDSGSGIPPHILPKIFDPYFTTKATGCGLGLSTAYSVIKNHYGAITASSVVGQGSTITLVLPARDQAPSTPVSSHASGNGEGRILVMDDEESIRLLLEEMLRYLGYEVHCVADGKEAVVCYQDAYTKETPFSAVILDLTVPGGMGGKEIMQQLQEFDPQVKGIVASGYCNDSIISRYAAFGFQGVVAKPFRLTELSQVLHQVIGQPSHTIGTSHILTQDSLS